MNEKKQQDRTKARWVALKQERSSWDAHWTEIAEYLLPRSGRFQPTDRNKGDRKHNNIYDSTGTRALRTLAAGLMAGMTSPARPWFRLSISDTKLAANHAVKVWSADVSRMMLEVFQRSNLYRALHTMYEELGTFSTGAMIVLPDYDDVIRCYSLTAGEYAIATDYRGQVNTLYREFDMTVAQLVDEFGEENCSATVVSAYKAGNLDQWFAVIHAIEPRTNRDNDKDDSLNMPFRSCYFEVGADDGKYLREAGFKRFPALCPRWSTSGGDIYGNGPGMECLGDIKQLMHEQLRKGQSIDELTNPALQAPAELKNRDIDTLPGGITFIDGATPHSIIRPIKEMRIDLNALLIDIQDVRQRINAAFYADLFLMLANSTDTRMTATEVAERHEEKLLMLGPVLERLHNELLDPLIDLTFDYMAEAGLLPPPPPELQGMDLNVEFVSMLAQAQRAIGVNGIDRYVSSLMAVANAKPGILDKLNEDRLADRLQDHLGVDPDLIRSDEEVAAIRQARAQAQQQQEQAAMMQQAATTAQKLASADTSGQNALTDVAGMFNGYMSPGVLQ